MVSRVDDTAAARGRGGWQLPSRSSSGGNDSDERHVMSFIQFLGQRQQGIEVAKAMRNGDSNEKPGECRQPRSKDAIRLSRA